MADKIAGSPSTMPKVNALKRHIQRVEKLRNELKDKVDSSPQNLSDRELNLAISLGNQLDDRFRLTQLYLEILHRGDFSEETKREAIHFLEENGICSLLKIAEQNVPIEIPERCKALPEDFFK